MKTQPPQKRPRRHSRGSRPFLWLGAFLLIVGLPGLIFLALLYASARYVPPPEATLVDTTPQAARQAEAQVVAVKKTLETAADDAKKGKKRPYRVAVKQGQINTLLRTNPRLRTLMKQKKVERPFLSIKDGRLRAGALLTYQKKPVYITAEGPITANPDGTLAFRPETVWLGKIKAPVAVSEEIAERAAKAFAAGALKMPGQVSAVRLEKGQIVIEGTTGGGSGPKPPPSPQLPPAQGKPPATPQ